MLRSKIILAAVDGSMNAGVEAEISVRIHTVRKCGGGSAGNKWPVSPIPVTVTSL